MMCCYLNVHFQGQRVNGLTQTSHGTGYFRTAKDVKIHVLSDVTPYGLVQRFTEVDTL